MSRVNLFMIAVSLFYEVALGNGSEMCQSILQVAASNTNCEPLGDCTGISCYAGDTINKTVTVAVNKCTDPLEVNITVYNGDESVDSMSVVTGADILSDTNFSVVAFSRNEYDVTISVAATVPLSPISIVVPSTQIPLNASDCMCQAITQAGESIHSPIETNCMPNQACNGQECELFVFGQTFLLEVEIIQCSEPQPSGVFVLRDSQNMVLAEYFVTESRNISIFNLPLYVMFEHRDYSVITEARLDYGGMMYQLVPRTQIIVDRTICTLSAATNASSVTMVTATPTLTPPQQSHIAPETCQSLRNISSTTNAGGFTSCTVNTPVCDTITCVTFNEYTSSFQLLPCLDPPAVHVILLNNDVELFNRVLTESITIPVSSSASIYIGITQEEQAIDVELSADLGFGPIPILPKSRIPVNTCYCPMSSCFSSMATVVQTATPTRDTRGGVSSNAVVAASVTVGVVILIIVAAAFVVVVFFVLFKLRKSTGSKFLHRSDSVSIIQYTDDSELIGDEEEIKVDLK